ncbi:hypothetical protein ACFE04_013354 [Oxalis oulophora]
MAAQRLLDFPLSQAFARNRPNMMTMKKKEYYFASVSVNSRHHKQPSPPPNHHIIAVTKRSRHATLTPTETETEHTPKQPTTRHDMFSLFFVICVLPLSSLSFLSAAVFLSRSIPHHRRCPVCSQAAAVHHITAVS